MFDMVFVIVCVCCMCMRVLHGYVCFARVCVCVYVMTTPMRASSHDGGRTD